MTPSARIAVKARSHAAKQPVLGFATRSRSRTSDAPTSTTLTD